MAPFLRASLHALRYTLCPQRERCVLKRLDSKYSMCRWYNDTAILEDSTPAVIDTNGENGASSEGSDLVKSVDYVEKQEIVQETLTVSTKQEHMPEESTTDKLTSLILGKMRSKTTLSSAQPIQTGPASSKAGKLPEESKDPVRGDKWDQVMESMRNMAAKRKEQLASGGVKPTPSPKPETKEDLDDFADLDYPSGNLSKALSNSDNLPSTDEAFKSFLSNSKHREGGFQAPNAKQKIKEAKAVSFSFLKALDNDTTPSRAQNSGSQSMPTRNVGSPSSKPKDNGFVKPLSFDFLKTPESKGASSLGVQAKTDTPRSFSLDGRRDSDTHSHPSAAGGITRTVSIDDLKRESSSTGYMVSVQNLSSQTNLALIKEALSIHGEVISSFKKSNSDGSCSAFIEFKTAEAMDDALASRWLQIDSKSFSIVRADSPITTVVRISRVSADTTESQLQAMCEKFGSIDNIRKRGIGIYDVFYKMGELSNMSAILDSLNEVTLNQRRLVALPAPLLHPAMKREILKGSEGQAWHANQLSQTLSRIEMGLEAVSVNFEDLKSLVAMEDEITR